MTIIIGALDGRGNIIMGSDRCVSWYGVENKSATPKVVIKDDLAFGVCGYALAAQLIKYRLDVPSHPPEMPDDEYISVLVSDAMKECFKKHNLTTTDKNRHDTGSDILIGYSGVLYSMSTDFAVVCFSDNFMALGSGWEPALGAMYALTKDKKSITKADVVKALEAAARYSRGVDNNFDIITLKRKKK